MRSSHNSRRLLLVEISDRQNGRVGRARLVLKASKPYMTLALVNPYVARREGESFKHSS